MDLKAVLTGFGYHACTNAQNAVEHPHTDHNDKEGIYLNRAVALNIVHVLSYFPGISTIVSLAAIVFSANKLLTNTCAFQTFEQYNLNKQIYTGELCRSVATLVLGRFSLAMIDATVTFIRQKDGEEVGLIPTNSYFRLALPTLTLPDISLPVLRHSSEDRVPKPSAPPYEPSVD